MNHHAELERHSNRLIRAIKKKDYEVIPAILFDIREETYAAKDEHFTRNFIRSITKQDNFLRSIK